MGYQAVLRWVFIFIVIDLAIFACALRGSPTANAQDDPNAQYIALFSGNLSAEPREIDVPVEVGVLRLQYSVKFSDRLDLTIITPLGKPLDLGDPNVTSTEIKGRRTISMWDPKPGIWKMRLSGSGAFATAVTVQGDLYICCMQFFGRNGVYMMDRFQPARGSKQQAQVYASGYQLDTIEFQLINEQGELISPLKFRQSDYSNPSGFTLLFDTPAHPFRVLARGRDTNGKAYQRVFHWLIRTLNADGPNPQSENAPADTYNNQILQELSKGAGEGEQKIIRAQILKWSDEQLLSEKGNPIGIRLNYSMRFPVEGSYSPFPQLYPERIGSGYTGALSMRVHRGNVEPSPEGVKNPGQLVFGVRATFKTNVIYNFSVDLVPNYTIYNEQRKSFCVQTKPYTQQGVRERFEREVAGEVKLRFRFSISGTDLDGRLPTLTENTYVPNAWYRGYQREGAMNCP
jgi:hypothetical protein